MEKLRETEIEADTVEDAIKIALQKLSASRSDVDVKILFEGSKGLFGMPGAQKAKVRVTRK